ncbi:hypothetical protein SAMN05444266_107197 [Chitinophaga jiangningensis]|uniref:Uncharacterized protein n=1 Tax=Chitinophaga jiangningensis TaxID=1419482 RepID=A0A1M7HDN6_9BACT|nr:hypothetical protein SAMN05444266_107197 [Chitinophaga jiangningensis]
MILKLDRLEMPIAGYQLSVEECQDFSDIYCAGRFFIGQYARVKIIIVEL